MLLAVVTQESNDSYFRFSYHIQHLTLFLSLVNFLFNHYRVHMHVKRLCMCVHMPACTHVNVAALPGWD